MEIKKPGHHGLVTGLLVRNLVDCLTVSETFSIVRRSAQSDALFDASKCQPRFVSYYSANHAFRMKSWSGSTIVNTTPIPSSIA